MSKEERLAVGDVYRQSEVSCNNAESQNISLRKYRLQICLLVLGGLRATAISNEEIVERNKLSREYRALNFRGDAIRFPFRLDAALPPRSRPRSVAARFVGPVKTWSVTPDLTDLLPRSTSIRVNYEILPPRRAAPRRASVRDAARCRALAFATADDGEL